DDVTGEDGRFDPGANTVGLSLEGAGQAALRLSKFFFELLDKKGIPSHYIDADIGEKTMTVEPATPFGAGLEVICRYRAVGSFFRRYGKYVQMGEPLDAFVEFTLKDDAREDPPITKDALTMLGILSQAEYDTLCELTREIAALVKEELAQRQMDLYDIKFEFGRIGKDQEIALIDEISGGNMRAFKDGVQVQPLELTKLMLEGR
ncbi:MAG: phosphoribosylaminoimidazolesuccinocarboxamide synthase, partial [Limnochordia bacterium]|nr:phosphoribosylaminoimidazolesuccinocarboxamide synthase [Limnochordia bacterium]